MLFISYSREDQRAVQRIATNLNEIGVDVWRDQRLSRGQEWWDEILDSIRRADAVLLVLSEASLRSVTCARELAYAEALGKPILPIRIERTSPELAPQAVPGRAPVDYVPEDRGSVRRLARAVDALERPRPLPDPLPEPPSEPFDHGDGGEL
jgi:hypothetical protein